MLFRAIQVPADRVDLPISRIQCETFLVPDLGDAHPDHRSSPRLSSLLDHCLSCGTVQRRQDPNSETTQDYSARCDVLFPGYIHFASRTHDVSLIRKCKDIVIMFYHLSTAHLDLHSLESNYSLPGM